MTPRSSKRNRNLLGRSILLFLATLYGCDQLDPLAPDGRVPSPRRAVTWGSERLVATGQLPVECGLQGTLIQGPDLCGASGRYPVALGPGSHLLRVRLSGKMSIAPRCAMGKSEIGPLGLPWAIYPPLYGNWFGIGYSYLTTLPYWLTPSSYVFMLPAAVSADSSVVDYTMAVDGDGEIVMDTQQPLHRSCNLAGSYAVEIFVQDPAQTPKLRLNCSPAGAVTRGDSITCVAAAEPQGAVRTELAWSFVDTLGHTIVGPTGTDTLWGGRMVVPGLLKVSGKVDGVALSDSLPITVSARVWPKIQLSVRNDGHGDLPAVPTSAGDLAHTHFDSLPATSLPVRDILDGPNRGWAYLAQPIDSLRVVVHVSNAWQTGSAWFNLQHHGTFYNPVIGGYQNYCTKAQITQLLPSALQHEGLLPGMVSHVQLLRQWFNSNSPEVLLEAAVVYPSDWGGDSSARLLRDYDIARLQSAALADPAQKDGKPGSLVQLPLWPCKPRY